MKKLLAKKIEVHMLEILAVVVGGLVVLLSVFTATRWVNSADRDAIRIGHLDMIEQAFQEKISTNDPLPLADAGVKIYLGDEFIGTQGFIGPKAFEVLGLSTLLDPDTKHMYTYFFNSSNRTYEVATLLEKTDEIYRVGNVKKILYTKNNLPLQEKFSKEIDLKDTPEIQDIFYTSCRDILSEKKQTLPSGIYDIWFKDTLTSVYCDMETDGGGWTLFYANNGHEESPLSKSYVEFRDDSKKHVMDITDYENPLLAGMLDYTEFTENLSKEILVKNNVSEDPDKYVIFSFDDHKNLDWALSEQILGKTEIGCITLPRNGTWSIRNSEKYLYEDLQQMMNHGGTNWGVSHEKFSCNGLEGNYSPHIAFYSANDNRSESRARSNDGIGGSWGAGNEYRYFIR